MKDAVTYVRVSSKEQFEQGFSPEAQRVLLYQFARTNDFTVVKEFEDVESAKAQGRKSFLAMIEYVKANDIKYILVEKTDRLHRNFQDYVLIEELTEQHNVTLFLVKENTSIGKESKSSEKLMYGMRTLLAKNFIDNLREESQKGVKMKLQHGEYAGRAPLGYINSKDPYNPKHNIITVDPLNKDLIVKMYEYYATGNYSIKTLIAKLAEDGLTQNIPTRSGKLHVSTVAKYLSNVFYIGQFVWDGVLHTNASHEAIVSIELWQQVQQILAQRNNHKVKKHNTKAFSYKHIFTCDVCAHTVTAEKKKNQYNYYHCSQYKKCGQPWVNENDLDKATHPLLNILKLGDTGMQYVTAALKSSLDEKREWSDKKFEALIKEQTTLKERMDKMYEDRLDGKINDNFYDNKFAQYTQRLQEIEQQVSKHNKADISYYEFGVKIIELAENAIKLAEMATPEEKNELLHYLLSNSTLKDKQPIFELTLPYKEIAKRAPAGTRSGWQGMQESNPP
ncbi:MAG: hypothetical protein COW24_01050 [Candidatus Kerfeldbacteria bacterium CG15_BIG_FIL_POST_REV_8_21_14_020_45_12]|uniref:Recombinase family protein n=1 Tax=Candidatus Kerfeldbacteria bacterium CG15_BIG_FIL_POST_REV_8_21_14_020_45_12 TaxID=2014247 RepID=A0A2M7H4X2_9BACT|nr:MAG: hypothetical protein COW24_01050 [Candidatus Kerfeldbacteria bacterium CG15_BIG_FIL_POST_REV_8_21_14_020_45_12]PJA93792.1 MAG: hypothetical protein CO132_01535 [Candidatus Kerfeldbacteria bacterium CG_4_9_14_3_um_filter_45_8]